MVSYIFFILAAICSASMDVSQFHYSKSIFVKLNKPMYFNGEISWKAKYKNWDLGDTRMRKWMFGLLDYPVFLTDFWHLMKSCMLVFICISIVTFNSFIIYEFNSQFLNFLIGIIAFGTSWNLAFNAFYNHILVKK